MRNKNPVAVKQGWNINKKAIKPEIKNKKEQNRRRYQDQL